MDARYNDWEDLVPNLQVGDIMLVQNILPISNVVRSFTGSYWSHAGMVFEIMHPDAENRIALVIEAQDNGIEIHRLRIYANQLGIQRLGFKRVPGLTDEQREKIRSFFIQNIDVPYDYGRIYSFVFGTLFAKIFKKDISDFVTRKGVSLENFVCSTFVQRAFYLALPPGERDRAVFRKGSGLNLLEKLEVCTPSDIAHSANAEWLWNPRH